MLSFGQIHLDEWRKRHLYGFHGDADTEQNAGDQEQDVEGLGAEIVLEEVQLRIRESAFLTTNEQAEQSQPNSIWLDQDSGILTQEQLRLIEENKAKAMERLAQRKRDKEMADAQARLEAEIEEQMNIGMEE
jgi:hypothetical protein